MSAAPLASDIAGSLRRFSVAEYHRLIETGVLAEGEPIELLEGLLVRKVVRKPLPDAAVSLVEGALSELLPSGWFCRVQSAVTTADSEPEPDVAVARGPRRRYLDAHPSGRDVALVVEVADSSLERDRVDKARIYAHAGIAQYWLVNLVDEVVEVRGQPGEAGYGVMATLRRGDTARATVGDEVVAVGVAELLP